MASQNIARLGVVLGLDTAEFTASIDKAIAENVKLKNAIRRETDAAAKEIVALKYATEDYGKVVSKVTLIEREMSAGRFKNATPEMKKQLLDQAKAYDAIAMSAKNAAGAQFKMNEQQKMQLTYQTTDLFTQLASGQNPFIAIMQQGGQLKDAMGGIGNAIKAVGSLFTATRVIAGGFAASLGAVAFAAYSGRDEFDKFNDTLTLTGRYAGVTAEDFYQMTEVLSKATNMTIGSAKEAFNSVVASGRFAKESLGSVTQAILQYAQIAGVDAKTASDKLIAGLDGSASNAKSLNKEMNFLTLEQYKQIEALEKAGKQQEAAKIASDALNTKLAQQRRELGTLEKAWQSTKNAVSEFWNMLKEIGKPETTDQVIAKLESQIEAAQKALGMANKDSPFYQRQQEGIEKLKQEKESLLEIERLKKRSESAKDVGKSKQEIEDYTAAGGIAKARQYTEELEKAKSKAALAAAALTANERQKIDLEAEVKKAEITSEMRRRNEDERGVFSVQNAKLLSAKIAEIESERLAKIEAIKTKIRIAEYDEYVRTQQEITDATVAEDNRRAELRVNAQAATRSIEFEKERLELKSKIVYSSEKEQKLAMISLEYARKRKEIEGSPEKDFLTGQLDRQEAIEKMNVSIQDSLQRTQQVFDSVWGNMSSAIDNFVRTGKLSFKDFTRSVIQDMVAMQMKLQAMALVRGLIASFMGPQGTTMSQFDYAKISGYADGGSPPVNQVSVVGERGPELFVPRTAGTIIPNHQLGGMGGTTNVTNNYINAIDTKSFEDRLLGSSNAVWAANQYAGKNLATNFGRT